MDGEASIIQPRVQNEVDDVTIYINVFPPCGREELAVPRNAGGALGERVRRNLDPHVLLHFAVGVANHAAPANRATPILLATS